MPHIIYGLYDPTDLDQKIRYVGYSSQKLSKRLIEHLSEARSKGRCHRLQWLRSLIKKGVVPSIVALDVATESTWQDAERHWIKTLSVVYELVNSTDGGDGLVNPSDDVRRRIGEKVSKILIGNSRRAGVLHDEASRAAISAGLRNSQAKKDFDEFRRGKPGHKISDEAKRKISEANKGRPRPDASRLVSALNANRVGSFWITNGIDSKQLKQSSSIPDGWKKGRIGPSVESKEKASKTIKSMAGKLYTPERNLKVAASRVGGRWINNGTSNAYIKAGEALPDGWKFGRVKNGA